MHPTILLVLGALPIMTTRHYLQQPASNSNPGLELFFVKAKKWGVCTNEGMNKTMGQAKDFAAMAKGRSWDKWHQILGHVNLWTIKTLLKNNLVTGLLIDENQEPIQCLACIQGKRHVEPFPKEATKSVDKIRDLVLSNVWGLAQIEGTGCEKYFYSFIDTRSRYLIIYFRSTKDEALKHFTTFKEFLETQTGNKIKKFCSDNGGEYVNKPFKEFRAKHGIIMEMMAPYSPAQNGIVEWLN